MILTSSNGKFYMTKYSFANTVFVEKSQIQINTTKNELTPSYLNFSHGNLRCVLY